MKDIWIIANWKSNKTIQESIEWVDALGPKIEHRPNIKVVVCPTLAAVSEVRKAVQVGHYPLLVGVQNISPFGVGAYTGEQPAELLKGLVDVTLLGHSERRQNFQEDDEMIESKVSQAVAADITPVVCVPGKDTPVPSGVSVIAYEPIFAIGSGTPDTPENANEVATVLKEKYDGVQVLYGGSVKPDNVKAFLSQESIDGVLVGGASLDPETFLELVQATYSL